MLSSNTPHCTPLECENLDISYSIDISILWIEERDSDQNVLLAERIIPTGIMARSQVTLHIAQNLYRTRYSLA